MTLYTEITKRWKTGGEVVDDEWVALIIEALAMGITEEEIREFLCSYNEDNGEGVR